MNSSKSFLVLGSLFGFLGVAGGAFAAHSLRDSLSPDLLAVFETGIRYQMYHAFALLAAGWALKSYGFRDFALAGWAFTAGVALFSGSLYIMALTGVRWIGIVTPLGGLAFLSGWILLGIGFWKLR